MCIPREKAGYPDRHRHGHFLVIAMHVLTCCFLCLLFFLIGLQITVDAIINKWKKLKQKYKTECDNQRRSGTECRKKWKFFNQMDEICGYRATSTPVLLIDSSLENESKGK